MGYHGFDIVAFDLDGTLMDTRADIAAAVNVALAHAGRDALPVERVVTMVGGGVRHLLEQALDATGGGGDGAAVKALLPVLLDHYVAHPCDHATIYPGVREALDRLAAAGVRMGIVTNKNQAVADATLARSGLAGHFDCVLGDGAGGVARGKPAPDALIELRRRLGGGRAAYVGDTRYDVEAARAADLPVIACRFGFAPDTVDALGADAVIDRFADLLPALAAL